MRAVQVNGHTSVSVETMERRRENTAPLSIDLVSGISTHGRAFGSQKHQMCPARAGMLLAFAFSLSANSQTNARGKVLWACAHISTTRARSLAQTQQSSF